MALPILNELKGELERLYIAGGALAYDDPRIKKYIHALDKLGERAPVFKKLSAMLSALIQSGAKPEQLLEAGAALFSVVYSQGRAETGGETMPMEYAAEPLGFTPKGFLEISGVISSIRPQAYQCHEKLKELYVNNRHRDPRLYKAYIDCVKRGNAWAADYACNVLVPSLDGSIVPMIESELRLNGNAGDARLFTALYLKIGKLIHPLSEKVLEEGSAELLAAALPTLAGEEKYREVLEKYAGDRRKIVKEAAERALSNEAEG